MKTKTVVHYSTIPVVQSTVYTLPMLLGENSREVLNMIQLLLILINPLYQKIAWLILMFITIFVE